MTKSPSCSKCLSEYDCRSKVPKVLPCGNSICAGCANLEEKCPFCKSEHSQPFPTNKFILNLVSKEPEPLSDEQLDEIRQKNKALEQNVQKCQEHINQQYLSIEHEIDARTEKLIEDLNKSRDSLIRQLNEHKENSLMALESVPKFKITKHQNADKLVENIEHGLKRVELVKKNLSKPEIRFVKSNLKVDLNSFLGKLDTGINDNKLVSHSAYFTSSMIDLKKFRSFEYKIPFNCKNIILGFLPDSTLVKVVEEGLYDNFQFTLNIDLVEDSKIVRKISESIGAYRLKKVVTNNYNNFFVVLISNKFNESQDYLKLYDENLTLFKTKGLAHSPQNILMCDKFVYLVKQNNQIDKYDFSFKLLETYTMQGGDRSAGFYVPKSYHLVQIQNDRLFFLDLEKARVQLISERNGKVSKSFEIDFNRDLCLIQIDSNDLVYVLNRKNLKLTVYNLDGILLVQKRLDPRRIEEIDYFHAFMDQRISVLDKKNRLIHFI
ncbi:hypothetical protein BpHYR1_001656 [Brachionus plicatilis]|uniref:RING-type domain-containing protein n=1 Tax=Brachionus plicatilis TaxID=10195 RepID=A0A3M7SXE3_BRAPC|nr:hypothetical protein BpHYR1_001656 [Brachionus plicatilis]